MQQNTWLIAALALLIGGIGGYALGQSGDWHGMGMMGSGAKTEHRGDHADQRQMDMMMGGMSGMDGMHDMHGMMVDSERAFLEGMIPHHQEAVDTANEVLARGGTTENIRTLAQNIITSQEVEIASMKAWYEAWYGEPYVDTGLYEPMMRDLSNLSGAELDRTFLEDMIMHHMGAIMMARSVEPYIEHDEISDLASAIVTNQMAEIAQMRQYLQEL